MNSSASALPRLSFSDVLLALTRGPWTGVFGRHAEAPKAFCLALKPPIHLDLEGRGEHLGDVDRDVPAIVGWFRNRGELASDGDVRRAVEAACLLGPVHALAKLPAGARHWFAL